MPRATLPPAACAQCGATLPPRAHACPECGADERTGWREQSIYDGLDLPEPEAESPQFPRRSGSLAWYWLIAAVIVLLILVLSAFGLR